jgi:hypothetical protein
MIRRLWPWAMLFSALGCLVLSASCGPQIPLPPPDEKPQAIEGDATAPAPPTDAGLPDLDPRQQTDAGTGHTAPLQRPEAVDPPSEVEGPAAVDPTALTHP